MFLYRDETACYSHSPDYDFLSLHVAGSEKMYENQMDNSRLPQRCSLEKMSTLI